MTKTKARRLEDYIALVEAERESRPGEALLVDEIMRLREVHGSDRLHRGGEPLAGPISDAEFREGADHIWLNAFSCISPSDEFLAGVGRDVVHRLNMAHLRTAPIVDDGSTAGMSPACVIWFNKS